MAMLDTRGIGAVTLLKRTFKEFGNDDMSTYASALAYRGLFSMLPFLLFLIALLGFLDLQNFFDWLRMQAELALPPMAMEQINPVIDQLQEQKAGLLSFGIVVALWTASVGFRAPAARAMISEFAEYIANQTSETLRYADPDIEPQAHPSEISASALGSVKDMLGQHLKVDEQQLAQWFGEYMTDARSSNQLSESHDISSFETLKEKLIAQEEIQQSPFSRFLFSKDGEHALMFVDGQSYECSTEFAETLCQQHMIDSKKLINTCSVEKNKIALLDLYNRGCID